MRRDISQSASRLNLTRLSLACAAENMKIVTAIYLNCRPDLRDEWLVSVMEKDELEESNVCLSTYA